MKYSMGIMIIGGLFLISVIAIGLTIFINLQKFSDAYENAIGDRFYFAMGQAAKVVEAELQLGHTLDKLKTAQKALDQLKTVDEHVVSAEIFDEQGRTIYSTDNSYLFDYIPDSWEQASKLSDTAKWQIRDDQNHALGLKIQNSLNQSVGSIVLLFSNELEDKAFEDIKLKLIKYALILGSTALIALMFLVYYMTRPFMAYLSEIEKGLDEGETDQQEVKQFLETYEAAAQNLDELENTLHKIDEGRA